MNINSIKQTLKEIDDFYKYQDLNSQYNIPNELLCKTAILELCGWLEEFFDNLILKYSNQLYNDLFHSEFSNSTTSSIDCNKKVKDEIDSIYGLSYKNHLRKLLILSIGIPTLLIIEEKVGTQDIERLSTELGILHKQRNELAHNSYPKIIQHKTLDAPSVTLQKLNSVYPILVKLEEQLDLLSVTLKK